MEKYVWSKGIQWDNSIYTFTKRLFYLREYCQWVEVTYPSSVRIKTSDVKFPTPSLDLASTFPLTERVPKHLSVICSLPATECLLFSLTPWLLSDLNLVFRVHRREQRMNNRNHPPLAPVIYTIYKFSRGDVDCNWSPTSSHWKSLISGHTKVFLNKCELQD